MSEQVFSHKPVLLDECIETLAIRPEGVYLDGTLGRAGHSREIVRRLTTGRLICVDRDQAALDAAEGAAGAVAGAGHPGTQQFLCAGRHPGRAGPGRGGRHAL